MADIFEIAGRIHSTSQEEVVTVADEILDTAKNKKQDEINTETYSLVNDINERLSGLNPEQQSALSVAAKATNNETKLGYYVCGTEGNVAAKVISDATGYVLSTGGSIKIKMTNANIADNATLNINSTGAKPLYYDGERASANNTWGAGETVEIYYDGTNFYANNVAGSGGDGVFDVSEKYPTSGVEGGNTYTLDGALAVLNANLPASKKKGGMSIKFVQSSDNKYVQARCKSQSFSADPEDWTICNDTILVENTEFGYVLLSKSGKIVVGVQNNGNVYYGAGVPKQVVDYINKKIAELSLDEYEDIVTFLGDIISGDKTLQQLLNEKVDKETGKSLISSDVADSIDYYDNGMYWKAILDNKKKIIEGFRNEGYKEINMPVKINSGLAVEGVETKHLGSIEFSDIVLDNKKRIVAGLKTNGDLYLGYGVPSQVANYIADMFNEYHSQYGTKDIHEEKETENALFLLNSATYNSDNNDYYQSPVVLLHFSDLHSQKENLQRIMDFYNNHKNVIDDVISTGDQLQGSWSDSFSFWDECGAGQVLLTNGNHDATMNGAGTPYTDQSNVFQKQYAPYLQEHIANGVVIPNNAETDSLMYYYKDYTDKNVRLISIDGDYLDNTQILWLRGVLENARQSGLHVVVMNHYPFKELTMIDCGFNSLKQYITIDDKYCDYTQLRKVEDEVNTFITNGGTFICHLAGHYHYSIFAKSTVYPNQLCIAIPCAGAADWLTRWGDIPRINAEQDCFNIFSADTHNKIIRLFRIGADRDIHLRKQKSLAFDYENMQLLYCE